MTRKSQPPPPRDTDLFPPMPEVTPSPKPPVKAKSAPPAAPASTLRVMGCELQTAPEHLLIVRLSGETEELAALRRSIMRSLHPDDGSEAGLVPADLSSTLPRA